jgi:hypothetical protein
MSRDYPWVFLALVAAVATGGYAQVHADPIFWCGLVESYPQTIGIAVAVLLQAFLYLLSAGGSDRLNLYQVSQWVLLPLVLFGLFQAFRPHPFTALLFLGLFAIPVAWAFLRRSPADRQGAWPLVCGFFVTSVLGFYAALGEIPLLFRGSVIGYAQVAAAGIVAIGLSLLGLRYVRRAGGFPADRLWDFRNMLPFSALLLPVLRAKFPDVAYDSYMYKSTLPLQIAEWRTGDTALVDGFMVGTNLQELLNALLILVAPDHVPSLISTVAYVLLFLLIPTAFPFRSQASNLGRALVAFAGLATFTLTEAGIAQGTSYQEPLMLLFLVAAMIRAPSWPLFMALAILVKVNAVFIAPLVLVFHLVGYGRFWLDPRRLLIGCVVFALALAPHFARNVAFSGRILGLNETFSAVTDPPGPGAVLAAGETRYDGPARGGILSNALLSACNMFALKGLCATQYEDTENAGFHIFPASRSPLFGVLFAVFAVGLALFRRDGRLIALASAAAFFLSYAALLTFMTEGRYFMPLSFGFALLLLVNIRPAEYAIASLGSSGPARAAAIGLGCLLIGSNLLPGVLTNVSWICNRNLLRPSTAVDMHVPRSGMEVFLAGHVERYKQSCPPPGLPPVILAQLGSLDSPYLGTQRIFHTYTQQMIARFFAAEPSRQSRAAEAIIAVVARSPDYPISMLGASMADFELCFAEGDTRAYCSRVLAPTGPNCARSLYGPP